MSVGADLAQAELEPEPEPEPVTTHLITDLLGLHMKPYTMRTLCI